MITITMKLRHALAALCLAACNGSLGDMTDSSDETSATNPTEGASASGLEEWEVCNAANPCPDGQFCFNGICALGCNSDGDCADNQYCATDDDMLCHNKTVTSCPEVPCAEGQTCVSGLCSTPPPDGPCDPSLLKDCGPSAFCIEFEGDPPKCYTFPYCPQEGNCPTGLEGATCNDGLIPEKDNICLPGLCRVDDECPGSWFCVEIEVGLGIGYCSSGAVGSECNSNLECASGNCEIPAPGFPGVCL